MIKSMILYALLLVVPLAEGEEIITESTEGYHPLGSLYEWITGAHSAEDVFFIPGKNIAAELITTAKNKEKNFFQKVYGNLPCECSLGGCDCCVNMKLFYVLNNGCVKLRAFENDESALFTIFEINNLPVFQRRLAFDETPPFCTPLPFFPPISVCIRVTNITKDGSNIKACVNFDLRITGILTPLWSLQFTCVRFGFSGFSFFNPELATTPLLTTSPQSYVDDPTPLCVPVPSFPFVAGCIHFTRIVAQNGFLKGCIKLEFRLSGTDIILWEAQFSCFRIGMNGITFNRPNKKKGEKPAKQCSNKKPPKARH